MGSKEFDIGFYSYTNAMQDDPDPDDYKTKNGPIKI